MISNFFVLSPRGDTIIAKQYRTQGNEGAHERTHTEAFFRKVKFWDDMNTSVDVETSSSMTPNDEGPQNGKKTDNVSAGHKADPPPVFLMPDGLTYLHVKRNGLLFGCSTARNVSPCTIIEVRLRSLYKIPTSFYFIFLNFVSLLFTEISANLRNIFCSH